MKVQEFRELTARARQLVVDLHACVDAGERLLWVGRASRDRTVIEAAKCPRGTKRDLDSHQAACSALTDLINQVSMPTEHRQSIGTPSAGARSTGQSRAGGYNKSAARAVRLGRAARSAMRRGYF